MIFLNVTVKRLCQMCFNLVLVDICNSNTKDALNSSPKDFFPLGKVWDLENSLLISEPTPSYSYSTQQQCDVLLPYGKRHA